MDNRPHTPENICYALATIAYNVLMLVAIMSRDALESVDWSWACTRFAQCLAYITPLFLRGLFHVVKGTFDAMCKQFLPFVLVMCVISCILAFFCPTIFWGLCKVLRDFFTTVEKANDGMEHIEKEYPYIAYMMYIIFAVLLTSIFLYGCLTCSTKKNKNIHNTENKTTINNAGDSNVRNIQNTRLTDRRNFQINIQCNNLQLPMQIESPTRKSPRRCIDQQLSPQQVKANGKARKSPRKTIGV